MRYRVAAIAARLPEGTAGDAMRYTLVSEGTSQLTEIVRRSNSDLNTVGSEIDRIGNEYEALSNQKFGGGFKENNEEHPVRDENDENEGDPENAVHRRQNQIDAFVQIFGREPVSPADWKTAAALDPHSYDPKFKGAGAEIRVAEIDPAPKHGTVRVSQWIEQRDVFGWPDISDTSELPPPLRHLGNDRLADIYFDPEDTKVTTYIDYENGLVVMRQNPTVEQLPDGSAGDVRVGAPTGTVTQLSDGSVRVTYDAGNPFVPDILMDPNGPLGGNQPSVNGDLVFTPGPEGVQVDGTRTDYPSMEIYQDLPDGSTRTVLIDPAQSGSSTGPMLNLPFHHDVGSGASAFEPFDTGDWNPRYDVRIPLPETELGPVTSPPSAATPPTTGVTHV